MTGSLQEIGGWGRFPIRTTQLCRPANRAEFEAPKLARDQSLLIRGNGRSYGDAAVNPAGITAVASNLDKMIAFDPSSGILRVEAGVLIQDLLQVMVRQGWFLPVVPGTQFVTIGGCIASDVHGKNQHMDGDFGHHVVSILLKIADGTEIRTVPSEPLFHATVGGMGLTGIILEADIKLTRIPSRKMMVEYRASKDLASTVELLSQDQYGIYSVAWLDSMATKQSLGRAVVMQGHHASLGELYLSDEQNDAPASKTRAVPFDFPNWTLNRFSVSAFNAFYYRQQEKKSSFVQDYQPYFFPLDAVSGWNKIYGKRGFVQYQFVVGTDNAEDGVRRIIDLLRRRGFVSFLSVIKRFGINGLGFLSFPTPGLTVALDIPVPAHPEGLFAALNDCDDIVLRHNGRVYLAKDARLNRETFDAMYPLADKWRAIKRAVDPNNTFRSALGERLGLCS